MPLRQDMQRMSPSINFCAAVASKMRDALVTIKKSSPGNDAGVTTCFQVGTATHNPHLQFVQFGGATISTACSQLSAAAYPVVWPGQHQRGRRLPGAASFALRHYQY